MWEENPKGENPLNQVGTENSIPMKGSGLRWDSKQGPLMCKAGKEFGIFGDLGDIRLLAIVFIFMLSWAPHCCFTLFSEIFLMYVHVLVKCDCPNKYYYYYY